MDRYPKKPCKYCGGMGHFPYSCYKNPKRKDTAGKRAKPLQASRKPIKQNKPLRQHGKVAKQWDLTRHTWLRKNPPPIAGKYWECYLRINPQCPRLLYSLDNKPDDDEIRATGALPITLDHVISRSRDPSKRYDLDNLRPACWWCNTDKGSKSVDQVRPNVLP